MGEGGNIGIVFNSCRRRDVKYLNDISRALLLTNVYFQFISPFFIWSILAKKFFNKDYNI
jgi:hypothetical protein